MSTRAENNEFARKWILKNCGYQPTEFGIRAFVLVCLYFKGPHHVPDCANINWDAEDEISLVIDERSLSSYDRSGLTELVFLAHDEALRISLSARLVDDEDTIYADEYHDDGESLETLDPQIRWKLQSKLILSINPRGREGQVWDKHPPLEEQVRKHRAKYCTPLESEVTA